VTSDRRGSGPSFSGGGVINWRVESAAPPPLNDPRVPAAAHGSRPLPAAHSASSGPVRGMGGLGGSLPSSSSGVGVALSLTIDDQAPLDCSRKSGGSDSGGFELDVPTVLNLTTSGQGGAAFQQRPSTSADHVDAAPTTTSPQQNDASERRLSLSGSEQPAAKTGDVIQTGGTGTTLNVFDVKPTSVSCSESGESRTHISTVNARDLEDGQAGQRIVAFMTLDDLGEGEASAVSSESADVTPASSDRRLDLETTSDETEDVKTAPEQCLETVDDSVPPKNKHRSPTPEGPFIYTGDHMYR